MTHVSDNPHNYNVVDKVKFSSLSGYYTRDYICSLPIYINTRNYSDFNLTLFYGGKFFNFLGVFRNSQVFDNPLSCLL